MSDGRDAGASRPWGYLAAGGGKGFHGGSRSAGRAGKVEVEGRSAALGTVAVVLACALGGPRQSPSSRRSTTSRRRRRPRPPSATPFQNPTPPTARPAAPARLNPFPYVRTAGSYTAQRTAFSRVLVRAPKGARLDARCNAGAASSVRRTVTSSRAQHLKSLQRSFKPRTTIEIRISSPTKVGKYVRIRTAAGRAAAAP